MKAKSLFLTVLLVAIFVAPGALLAGQPSAVAPVLFVKVTNSTGTLLALQVYNDGTSVLGQVDEDAPRGELCNATNPDGVRDLVRALNRAKADRLHSQDPVAGKSMKIITYFGNDQRGHSIGNTFVYYNSPDGYKSVADAINNFIGTSFATCE